MLYLTQIIGKHAFFWVETYMCLFKPVPVHISCRAEIDYSSTEFLVFSLDETFKKGFHILISRKILCRINMPLWFDLYLQENGVDFFLSFF